jgi:multidrug efflux pump subunit AcrA (membrane-fusion protein)
VLASTGEPVQAFAVPKSAVVRAANGDWQLWLHVEPERFVARPVRVSPLDGGRMLVPAGLKAGERVVVGGAELVNQVR